MVFTIWFSILILFFSSCATLKTQLKHYKGIEDDFTTRFYNEAVKKIEEAKEKGEYKEKDKVLFYLDIGTALHFAKRYWESNKYLDKAEVAIEENFTKSISKMALSFLLNDNILDYPGEDYEDIFVNVMKCLNYLHLKKLDEALVEIRRVNLKLNKIEDKYRELGEKLGENEEFEEGKIKIRFYKGEVDLRHSIIGSYLSMLGYLWMGKWDDVEIDKRKIIEASKGRLIPFLEKVTKNEEEKIPVYFLCFVGKGPIKEQETLLLDLNPYLHLGKIVLPGKRNSEITSFPYEGESEIHIKFAVPKIKRRETRIKAVRIFIDGESQGEMELIEDFLDIAEKIFEIKKPIIYLRSAIRSLLKALIDAKAKKEISEEKEDRKVLSGFLKLIVDTTIDISETADLRCWRTMPGAAYAWKIELTPGKHEVIFEYIDAHNRIVDSEKYTVFINKNELNLIEGVCYR